MADAKPTRAERPEAAAQPEDGARAEALAPTVIAQDLKSGDAVGEYRLCEELGSGTFGRVFRAVHAVLGREVAIKVLRSAFASNEQIQGRFVAEARAVNQVRHPNIVDVYAFGTLADGRPYYVMDLLPGRSLAQALSGGRRLPFDEALRIFRPLAGALAAAHAHGITHRDLKPENVYLRETSDGEVPMLLDFGIALIPERVAPGRPQTQAGMIVGTPCYMSPEQALGEPVDGRSDVFALGVLMYQMLTGRLPWDGRSLPEVLKAQLYGPLPAWPSTDATLPSRVQAAVMWMLRADTAVRCPDPLTAVLALEGGVAAPAMGSVSGTREDRPRVERPVERIEASSPSMTISGFDEHVPLLSRLAEETVRNERSGTRRLLGVLVVSAALFAGGFGFLQLRDRPVAQTRAFVFEGRPSGTEVTSADGRVLGRVPGRFALPRESLPLTVQIRAPGHRPQSRTLTEHSPEIQLVTLEPDS